MSNVTADLVNLYAESDALALADIVRRGEVSRTELVETAINIIEALDPKLNAVVIRTFALARETAARSAETGPFAGVPFLFKNIGSMWSGSPLTAGLAYLRDFTCSYDSEMVSRIKRAGFVPLGRTNTPEGGWSIGTEPRLYGPTLNPWNSQVTPGGSSGGAAAAVAARMIPLAEASDGGGSIRVPASCCGLVGLKPSRGRITYGPQDVDLWGGSISTFCLTRTIRDSAAFLDAVAGGMTGDPYTAPRPEQSWLSMLEDRQSRLRIGFTTTAPWGAPLSLEVADAVRATAGLFEKLGHDVEEYSLRTDLEAAWFRYNDINAAETAADFERLAVTVGRPVEQADLAPFNWSLLQHGRALSAVQYVSSFATVRKAGRSICQELERYDVFLTPTLTQPARPVGYWSMEDGDRERYLSRCVDAAFMFAFNISGLPAMSVPASFGSHGTPIGIQLVGRYGDEATILRLGSELEQARPWILRRPPICAGR
jgi:amidase